MNTLGHCAQATRAVVDCVHRGDNSQKNLGCTNIARSFVPADVLLARLQSESISRAAFGIVRNTHESARHVALVLVPCGEVCSVRSAKPQCHATTSPPPAPDPPAP